MTVNPHRVGSVFLKDYLGLALPIAFQFLMWALVPACDAFMLGRIGQSQMAAVSLAAQVPFLMYMMAAAFAVGMSTLGAQYWGRRDPESVGKVLRIGLRFLCAVTWTVGAASILAPERLMRVFTGESELVRLGADYLRIAGWSYFIVAISHSLHTIMKATGHARLSVTVSVATMALNVTLNAALIFGVGPLAPMGVRGAATATLVALAAEGAAMCALTRRPGFVHPGWRRILEWHPALVRDYLRCCLPILGAYAVWGGGLSVYVSIMGHLGEDAAAANAVAAVVRDLLCCVCEGAAAAAAIMVGHALGSGDLELGRFYGRKALRISLVLGALASLAVLALSGSVLDLVTLSGTARTMLAGMMKVLALYMFGRYVNTILVVGVFTAGGDTFYDFYSLATTMWGLAVPMALLGAFVFRWPPALVFACTCIDEIGKLPWTFAHYRRYLWVRDLTRGHGGTGSAES